MTLGPLQLVFLGLRGDKQRDEVSKALQKLGDRGAIRIVDIAFATKQQDGTFTPVQEYTSMTDPELQQLGTTVGALVGWGYVAGGGKAGTHPGAKAGTPISTQGGAQGGDGGVASFAQEDFGESVQEVRDHIRELAKDVPPGATCAFALIEHLWMPALKDQLQKAGIVVIASALIRPRSLALLGAQIAQDEQASAQ